MKTWYLDRIKDLIHSEVEQQDESAGVDTSFINNLFPVVEEKIRLMEPIFGKQNLDEKTLKDYFDNARKDYLSQQPTVQGRGQTLAQSREDSWLTKDRFEQTSWHYSERYFEHLEKMGRSASLVEGLAIDSRKILSGLGDPKMTSSFFSKGLVVGEVQSGKTGNFNAVINGAIDSGYQLIIVLSGIMEDLRGQTQLRIEEDVIGYGTVDPDTNIRGPKGVSNIRVFGHFGGGEVDQVQSITSYRADFKLGLSEGDNSLNFCNILVCKKNVSILANLLNWLYQSRVEGNSLHDIPFLLIDDEADNASLNNEGKKGAEYASKVNGHIRALLALFSRKSYLAYTATPFANVLQDRNHGSTSSWLVPFKVNGVVQQREFLQVDNLFPDNFIHLLGSPSNYIGAKQIFETAYQEIDRLPLVQLVTDNTEHFPTRVFNDPVVGPIGVEHFRSQEEWNEKIGEFGSFEPFVDERFVDWRDYRKRTEPANAYQDFPYKLPGSLYEATLCFILAMALRESRDKAMRGSNLYQPHNTMLIHVSRFTRWQNKTKDLMDDLLETIVARLAGDPSVRGSIYEELERTWFKRYEDIVSGIDDLLPRTYSDPYMYPISFDSIKALIPTFVGDIEVKALNSVTKDKLKYNKLSPRKVIVIGGNRLSRGFTLEGLSVSYFIRTTNYSDSLFQMGRWFGYRPGYLDCCKIYTTSDALDGFNKTTRLVEELEIELKNLADQPGKSPSSYRLKIKKDPGVLQITRPAIMKKTNLVKSSYQDKLIQTSRFNVRKEKIARVWSSFKADVAPLFTNPISASGFLEHDTDAAGVIKLISCENNLDLADKVQMISFIELCKAKGKLNRWRVAIKTTGQARLEEGKGVLYSSESGLPSDVQLAVRKGPNTDRQEDLDDFLVNEVFRSTGKSKNIVSSPKDLAITLEEQEIVSAEASHREYWAKKFRHEDKNLSEDEATIKAAKKNFTEKIYREKIDDTTGVLLIYLLDSYYCFNQVKGKEVDEFTQLVKEKDHDLSIPIVGYAFGFPPISPDPGGNYVENDAVNEDEDEEVDYLDADESYLPEDASAL